MQNIVISIVLWNIIIVTLVLVSRLLRIATINWRWLGFGLVVFSVHVFFSKFDLLPLLNENFSSVSKRMNLDGKFLGLIVSLIAIAVACRISPVINRKSLGLTTKHKEESVLPALIMCAMAVTVSVILFAVTGKAEAQANGAQLALYSVLAGLDEELVYRGLLLVLFTLALTHANIQILGVKITYGGLLALVIYAVIHGVSIRNGGLSLSIFGIGLTFFYGLIFLWVKERTGSLLLPVLAHNAVNCVSWFLR